MLAASPLGMALTRRFVVLCSTAALAAARPLRLRCRGGSAPQLTHGTPGTLGNASALNATGFAPALNASGPALDLNAAHANATTNATDEGLRASIRAYFSGAKELWGDVKTWRRLRKEERNATLPPRRLSWHERRVKSQTLSHSLRMLPFFANPLPPPFGLVLVGVASLVPRTLLTPEFWTDNQALTFATEDSADIKRRHAKLLDALSKAAGGDGKAEGGLDALGDVGGAFGAGASLELARLRRKHLIRLARCIRPHPPSRWSLHFLRTDSIRRTLADAARAMSEEDEALARDLGSAPEVRSTGTLSPREVMEVCAERGLGVGGDHVQRLARLGSWCEARATLLSALGAGPDNDSASLVLHMPALLSALLEKAEAVKDEVVVT